MNIRQIVLALEEVEEKLNKQSTSKECEMISELIDKIIADLKAGVYNTTVAKNKIIMVENVNMLGIDEHNVDEVIDLELEAA